LITRENFENGRGGEIRTHDLLYPKQARYQATLRPDIETTRLPRAQPESNVDFSEQRQMQIDLPPNLLAPKLLQTEASRTAGP
jgi:hypothetical protein